MNRALALLTAAAAMLVAAAPAPQSIAGRWLTDKGKAIVEIGPCGQQLCGRVVKVLDPRAPKNATDIHNKDAKLRSRPIIGLVFLTGFTASDKDWRGRIYDPESGKDYRSIVKRTSSGLEVKGCLGPFCQTQNWTPAK